MICCPRCGEPCVSETWAKDHCKPSRIAKRTGYRTDSKRHRAARYKVPKQERIAIASMGAYAQHAAEKGKKK